jgi:peptide deformylase
MPFLKRGRGERAPGKTSHPEPARPVAILARVAEGTHENGSGESAEDEHENHLDAEREARRRAALAQIRTFGDPALRTRAADVDRFDDALLDEVARMTELMHEALGVGLAATQLGVMHRLLVYRAGPDAPLVAVVNPAIEWKSEELETAEEACLSLPGVAMDVERPLHVRVRAQDEHGEPITIEASGLESRVIQHEMDHLDGVLILDRTSRAHRKEALRALREGGTWSPPTADEELEPSTA